MGPSNELLCETGSFSCCQNPHRFSSQRFLKLSFPCAGTLGCVVCLIPRLFLLVYLHASVGLPPRLPCPPATALPRVLSARLPVFSPSTSVNECFFFNSLVVGLSYSSIFWQFWLFFVFKFVVLLLVVVGGKVYLPMPPSWPEVNIEMYFETHGQCHG